MSQLETATTILNALKSDLKLEKEAMITLLKDPKITDWNTIECKKYRALFDSIGIEIDTISASLNNCQQQATKISKQLNAWNVEIGNQLADCIDSSTPEAALASAQKLAEKVLDLGAMKEELQAAIRPLLLANKCLLQQLGIVPLITIAKIVAPGKKDQIIAGAAILPFLTEKAVGKEEGQNILSLRMEPERLEARFHRLVITKLPRMIEEVLFYHVENTLLANREIKTFLDNLAGRMEREITIIAAIDKELRSIQTATPSSLLKGILAQGQIMATLLSSLYHKQNLPSIIATASDALDSINTLCSIMKNRLIPSLQKEVEQIGSPLNPISISSRMTRAFFEGTGGIIRSLKLMMKSLKGQEAVNELELQQILEKGIINCKTFYGKSPDESKKMGLYIESMVGHYPKPFPYNDLFKQAQLTLFAYGEEVENFIMGQEIPKDIQLKITPPPARIGGLITAINKYKITFQKANADA